MRVIYILFFSVLILSGNLEPHRWRRVVRQGSSPLGEVELAGFSDGIGQIRPRQRRTPWDDQRISGSCPCYGSWVTEPLHTHRPFPFPSMTTILCHSML
ncbi:hypothetical protein F5141DRAFT_545755 [Pisolithus sp. B1]|nr:hypothetical protein F5141DRAFT_545755 [Pisolithus sp. B1]